MIASSIRTLTLIVITLFTAFYESGHAAKYLRPDLSKELFQLEKVPLKVNSMKEMSKQLVLIASREHNQSPAQQRASAQMLALAIQLDPTNQQARKIDIDLSKGKQAPHPDQASLAKARSQLRFYKTWLASEDAGPDANQLSKCLDDINQALTPDTEAQPDSAQWNGVIPAISAYQPSKPIPAVADNNTRPDPDPVVTPDPGEAAPPKETVDQSTQQTSLHIPKLASHLAISTETKHKYLDPKLNIERYKTNTKQGPCKVSLSCSPGAAHSKSLEINISPKIPYQKIDSESKQKQLASWIPDVVKQVIAKRHPQLKPSQVDVTVDQGTYALSNRDVLAASIALMIEASASNRPIREDVYVCASLQTNGSFQQPSNFWKLLKILREQETGGRLIVAHESASLLTQILVYGEPDFFTSWEVYGAKNLDEAMEAAVKTSPESIAKADELFQSIQSLTRTNDVTKLAVNKAVRKRLTEIKSLNPNHFSASALLLQGSGKRPMRISEVTLAHELRPIIRNVQKHLSSGIDKHLPSSSELKKRHSDYREQLDAMERIVDRSHDDLYQETLSLVNEYRRLATMSRRASSDSASKYTISKSATNIIFSMKGTCARLLDQIDTLTKGGTAPK
ncbi:hypothetical protein HW115_06745 [Verrucomicrobiaceae bacterium N1E253]|uniref:Uncharacterized protein n=1 Tax=Oceaniferula marina TaxID=2748318 RepID=A0A851GHG0_9BACT|nr:hypothetical protein [Oceaniferula marina]NWK55301.1 hypothetical protein [Oceaniferula marina]